MGRIVIVQRPRTPAAENEEDLALWYEWGRLCREAGGGAQRATKLGLASVCASGALVLLSAPGTPSVCACSYNRVLTELPGLTESSG